MAFISSLLSVQEPSGFWINIIRAFEGATKNYVLAIILLTVVIRIIWGLVDTGTKFNQQYMNSVQTKMQPELAKIKAKYENQPQVLQQKQNEVYKRYYGKSYYGSCALTFVVMGLNLLIFFTLFSGLNTMSAYKIANSYDSVRYTYVNCLNVTDHYLSNFDTEEDKLDRLEHFKDYENLKFVIDDENKTIALVYNDMELDKIDYKEDFSSKRPILDYKGDTVEIIVEENENIINLLDVYFPTYEEGEEPFSKDVLLDTIVKTDTEGNTIEEKLYLSQAIQRVAMEEVKTVYDETKDSFLWIENIWIADSPFNKSIVSYNTLRGQVRNTFEEGEEQIYNAFMPDLKVAKSKTNGYFILPILCIATAFMTMQLTKFYNNRKNKKKGLPKVVNEKGKISQIIVPCLLGIFALFYNSVFSIYMLTGQIVSGALLVPQLMFVDFVMDKRKAKKEKKELENVDYSRKF